MCEFCEKEKPIISSLKQFHDRIETVVVGISGNKLKCSTMVQTAIQITPPAVAEIEIDFCPKCGRKLSEDTKMSEWVARYQQEPLQVIDCNMCEHISITEEEQRQRGNQYPHICQYYMKRCKHNIMKRDEVFIYPCEECAADGYKNFNATSKGDTEEFGNVRKPKCGSQSITDETIAKIEQAFGFPLYDWQKEYLLGKTTRRAGGRRNGNTFAYCLRLLICDGEPIRRKELHKYIDEIHGSSYPMWFARYCTEIDGILKNAG